MNKIEYRYITIELIEGSWVIHSSDSFFDDQDQYSTKQEAVEQIDSYWEIEEAMNKYEREAENAWVIYGESAEDY